MTSLPFTLYDLAYTLVPTSHVYSPAEVSSDLTHDFLQPMRHTDPSKMHYVIEEKTVVEIKSDYN